MIRKRAYESQAPRLDFGATGVWPCGWGGKPDLPNIYVLFTSNVPTMIPMEVYLYWLELCMTLLKHIEYYQLFELYMHGMISLNDKFVGTNSLKVLPTKLQPAKAKVLMHYLEAGTGGRDRGGRDKGGRHHFQSCPYPDPLQVRALVCVCMLMSCFQH